METSQCIVIKKSVCVKLYTAQKEDWDCRQERQRLNRVKQTDVQSSVHEH